MNQSKYDLKNLKFIRQAFLGTISKFSNEQLNHIPEGFKNNLIWNFAHSVASTQSMCYGPSGNDIGLSPEQLERYKMGSKPEGPVSDEEIAFWKDFAMKSIEQLEKDMASEKFSQYHAWELSPSNKVSSVQDALDFSYFHEGTHLGYALAMKKLL